MKTLRRYSLLFLEFTLIAVGLAYAFLASARADWVPVPQIATPAFATTATPQTPQPNPGVRLGDPVPPPPNDPPPPPAPGNGSAPVVTPPPPPAPAPVTPPTPPPAPRTPGGLTIENSGSGSVYYQSTGIPPQAPPAQSLTVAAPTFALAPAQSVSPVVTQIVTSPQVQSLALAAAKRVGGGLSYMLTGVCPLAKPPAAPVTQGLAYQPMQALAMPLQTVSYQAVPVQSVAYQPVVTTSYQLQAVAAPAYQLLAAPQPQYGLAPPPPTYAAPAVATPQTQALATPQAPAKSHKWFSH